MQANHSPNTPDSELVNIKSDILQYQKEQSEVLATKLVGHFKPIVSMAAHKISRNRKDLYEDLFQVGQMSLLRSLQRFDPEHGVPFEAYAMTNIIGYMKNYLRDKSWYIQVPRYIKEKGSQVRKAIDDLTVTLNRSPEVKEIADYVGLSEEETMEVLAGQDYYQPASLDAPLKSEDSSETMADLIPTEQSDYEAIENKIDLNKAIKKLEKEERNVVHLAFRKGKTQRNIADLLGVSQMTVSRIQKRAISKLKKHLV